MFRPLRALAVLASLATMLILAVPMTSAAPGGRAPQAAYEGHAIALVDVASHHCHDAMYPLIQCFASPLERDLDLANDAGGTVDSLVASATATSYVIWYEAINYGGSSFTSAISYSDLGTIGWSNRISSFKSLNGGRPKWWQNTGFTGTSWRWPAGAQVPDVGAAANDQFSSVQNVR